MNRKILKTVLLIVLLIAYSCDEPETVVTNYVHPDGSVTRHIEMRNKKNNFELENLQVPFDSTWAIKDTIIIGEKKDTTWIKTAEKLFGNVEEINKTYQEDKGANKEVSRKAGFTKKFKWFNTVYRYSELIEGELSYGYPIKNFLNQEESTYFFSPKSINSEKLKGQDSLKYKALDDTINKKVETWIAKSMVSEWIGQFSDLTGAKSENAMSRDSLKKREDELVKLIKLNDDKFDSLWTNGIILKKFIGEENMLKFKTEADTALAIVTRKTFVAFKDYSVRIVMPGKVIGTNGFVDRNEVLLWPVRSDYFLTEPYEMWAECKLTNSWAWIVTGVFILFVLAGLFIKGFRKR